MIDKVIKRIVISILIICVMILGWMLSILLIFNRKVSVPMNIINYKTYYEAKDILYKQLYDNVCAFNNQQYKEYIEKDLGLNFYIYAYKNLGEIYDGKAYPTIRTIIIDDDLIGYAYCQTFAHEVLHLKLCLKNETYISYETFKYLYEDEVLHNVGVAYGWRQLTNPPASEYNIQAQVVYYLTNK